MLLRNTQPIKLNRDFRRLYRSGKSEAGGFVAVYCKPNKLSCNRIGFTVGKSVGKAVVRNRTKRLLRESYRVLEDRLNGTFDMIIVARNRAAGESYDRILRDMKFVFGTLGVLDGK